MKPPLKMTKLVVSAIRNLCDVQGSTTKDIFNYVSKEYCNEPSIERRLQSALKRGVEYGILRKKGAHYLLNTDTEFLTTQPPMERSSRRRKKKKVDNKKGKKKGAPKKGRGKLHPIRGKSNSRRGKLQSRRGHRQERKKPPKKRGGNDVNNMMTIEPFDASGPHDPTETIEPTDNQSQIRSQSIQSRQSRSPSRSPSSASTNNKTNLDGLNQTI